MDEQLTALFFAIGEGLWANPIWAGVTTSFGVIVWRLNVWDREQRSRMTPEQIADEDHENNIPGDW